jgi:GrpB-like predicted nucleotidyltransferase (UPF0157 family)
MPTLVEITGYDPSWPAHFIEAARRLATLLGDAGLCIDHVGSTSVPGLAAKPVIDIDVTLRSPSDIPSASDRLVAAGYEPRGSRYGDGVWAFLLPGKPGQRVYLCPPDSDTHRKRMIFRDRLRSDATLAAAYETLKRQLAAAFPLDGDGYTAAKGEFIRNAIDAQAASTA